jgi:molecular chaperone GrpE
MKSELQTSRPVERETDRLPPEAAVPETDALRGELREQKEITSRLGADFDNFKRRSRQEAEVRALEQKDDFIRGLLPVLDNLERALASGASPGYQAFHQGVEMTLRQLQQLLHQHGIVTQESCGQAFDPRLHEAVSQGHDPTRPDQSILEVFQRGYQRGEKVFRPAKVLVNDLPHARHPRHAR